MLLSTWNPPEANSEPETAVLRLCKKQKLWSFLRNHRHRILDEEIRRRLVELYADGGRGRPPVAPERLALAMLLQVAFDVADHEVPTLTAVDRRWQVVLDCFGATEPIFAQGTVFNFRERVRANGLMRALLDKTVAIARETRGFDHKKLRVVFDSSPLIGAGRVEDTFNLLGHAITDLVAVAAKAAGRLPEDVVEELGLTIGRGPSVKAALDVDWREPTARAEALTVLIKQFERVQRWLKAQFEAAVLAAPPLADQVAVVERILAQDTEPDPESPGPPSGSDRPSEGDTAVDTPTRKIREGGADRLVSLSDPDMRFGRKSSSRVFAGYKRHVVVDADVPQLICAVQTLPASRPEHDAAGPLLNLLRKNFEITEVQADRGYLPAEELHELRAQGVTFISKPPAARIGERFTKWDFSVDFEGATTTCPAGVTIPLKIERSIAFPSSACRPCHMREKCLSPKASRRTISLHQHEQFHREMAAELATKAGRAARRQRVVVEHTLAHVSEIQGPRARFRGLEKNTFDLERVAVVNNLFVLNRLFEAAAA